MDVSHIHLAVVLDPEKSIGVPGDCLRPVPFPRLYSMIHVPPQIRLRSTALLGPLLVRAVPCTTMARNSKQRYKPCNPARDLCYWCIVLEI